jgi:hypothetical protein
MVWLCSYKTLFTRRDDRVDLAFLGAVCRTLLQSLVILSCIQEKKRKKNVKKEAWEVL